METKNNSDQRGEGMGIRGERMGRVKSRNMCKGSMDQPKVGRIGGGKMQTTVLEQQ